VSFLAVAALAVGLFVLAPVVAHLLRRGRTPERVFPPALLVSKLETHSNERARLEDRTLLSFRAAMVLVLALLGATPLVRCSRLSVDRPHGASVAIAIVLDDSHSMRARTPDGAARWNAALEGARQLLRSVREGDAVALVLAGKPARIALGATTDLKTARAALDDVRQTDRSSDLENAIGLARAAIANLEQPDRKVIVLSDLSGASLDEPDVSAPLESLRNPVSDCALVTARRQGERLSVAFACSAAATGARQLRLANDMPLEGVLSDPSAMSRLSLLPQHGSQTLSFGLRDGAPDFDLELSPADDNPDNDRAPVFRATTELNIAVVTDAAQASVITGGPTIIEQALGAIRPDVGVRPLVLLPDEPRSLEPFAALILNDPAGLGPESRAALGEWIEKGGVALGLLGPASSGLQLSSTLEPFAERSARWEPTPVPLSVEAASLAWLGPEAGSLLELTRVGRTRLDGAELPGTTGVATWQDGLPFMLRRRLGSGLVLTAGLSAAVEHSDFALKPAFLALLDHVVTEAEQRRGPGLSPVGERWTFAAEKAVSIEGPGGSVTLVREGCDPETDPPSDCTPGALSATPELAGRYTVVSDGASQLRTARIDEHEITDPPGSWLPNQAAQSAADETGSVDTSPELALALLVLFAGELALRVGSEARRKRRAARALG
jgi:hypothetical protein